MSEIRGRFGWRYMIQREHWRGERPHYHLMVAPPGMTVGYHTGLKAIDVLHPFRLEGGETRAGVRRDITRHQAYLAAQQKGKPCD